ncbi:MAG: hypothetical protein LUG56_02270 [Lachnospiraceae bacterium]|nr:hypothetical protein [Lachnospiraceae bacterium]
MKIRTAVISVVVTGALIAGALYAAYYTVGLGKKTSVQVTPVRYVYTDLGYYYGDDSMYGTVTSRVSQNITLEADYPIEEIYVAEGDEVTEGTELFSYDMTEQEINLESLDIYLQTQQLELKRLQKELAQYTGTSSAASTTASLEDTSTVLTSSSGTASATAVSEDGSTTADESGTSGDQILDGEDTEGTETEKDTSGSAGDSGTDDSGITIESEDYTDEQYLSYVTNFETMMAAILSYITECDGEYSAEDIEIIGEYLLGSDDVTGVVTYYRTNLAGSILSNTTNASGETVEVTTYPLLDAVSALLSESELTTLQTAVEEMDTCHALYVDLLIGALSGKSGDDLAAAVTAARAACENLSGDAMAQVTLLTQLESYEAQIAGETESGSESESESGNGSETETETETESADVDIAARISAFLLMADAIFAESASPASDDYENAIAFYQMYLAVAQADIEGVEATMEGYSLSDETTAYLESYGTDGSITAAELTAEYQELCLACVKYMISALDPLTMTSEDLAAAQTAYDRLGTAWQILVNDETPSVSDYLTAYDIVLRIQALDTASEDFLTELSVLYTEYLSLTFDQLGLIWNIDVLMEYFAQYGLLSSESESESESETEFYWDDSYDYDFYDSDDSLTAEERQELIESLENQIQSQELDIRETELEVEKAQRVVNKKVVTATLDGTVVSIGDADGSYEGDYFATISNTTGLYAKGWISELALDTVNVGDTISGMTDYGDTFTAVIKEVSEYPDPYGSNYVYSENANASYYAFYALIEDSEGIEEGYAELTLSDAYAESSDTFYLESYFVRNDGTGNRYVYVEGDDGTLEKRYVTTGNTLWGYYIEITNGLSLSDYIAFPYGDNVSEGAPTEEVDSLDIYDD